MSGYVLWPQALQDLGHHSDGKPVTNDLLACVDLSSECSNELLEDELQMLEDMTRELSLGNGLSDQHEAPPEEAVAADCLLECISDEEPEPGSNFSCEETCAADEYDGQAATVRYEPHDVAQAVLGAAEALLTGVPGAVGAAAAVKPQASPEVEEESRISKCLDSALEAAAHIQWPGFDRLEPLCLSWGSTSSSAQMNLEDYCASVQDQCLQDMSPK